LLALQSIQSRCSFRVVAVAGASSRNSRLVQSSWLVEVPHVSVLGPTSPLALASAVWFSFDKLRQPQLSDRCALSSSSAFLQSLNQRVPSRPAAAGQHLSWAFAPYSTFRLRGPLAASFASARYVPSSGFGYPLDGLLPLRPRRVCFTSTALLGFTLRSLPLSKGIRRVSATDAPTCRFTRRYSLRRSDGPALRAAAPGFLPFRESLATDWFVAAGHWLLPWVLPFQGSSANALLGISPKLLPHASPAGRPYDQPRRRPGVSIGARPVSPLCTAGRAESRDDPHRVPHQYVPDRSCWPLPGLCVHLRPRRALLPTDQPSLGNQPRTTGVAQDCLWCQASATSFPFNVYSRSCLRSQITVILTGCNH
jgi:hypothetical protein